MAHDLRKGDMEHDDKVVQEFILVLMKEWGQELNDKDSISKMSVKGRMEATTYAQTRYPKILELGCINYAPFLNILTYHQILMTFQVVFKAFAEDGEETYSIR